MLFPQDGASRQTTPCGRRSRGKGKGAGGIQGAQILSKADILAPWLTGKSCHKVGSACDKLVLKYTAIKVSEYC